MSEPANKFAELQRAIMIDEMSFNTQEQFEEIAKRIRPLPKTNNITVVAGKSDGKWARKFIHGQPVFHDII